MRKCLVALTLLFACINTSLALDGLGTAASPWLIQSITDFDEFTTNPDFWDDHTSLETDIDLTGQTFTTAPIAPDGSPYFTGTFDGNSHTISNLTISNGDYYLGLFGNIGELGIVRNLNITDSTVAGKHYIGGLAAINSGEVTRCSFRGSIIGEDPHCSNFVSGLVVINNGTIEKCFSEVLITGGYEGLAGLVGRNNGSIIDCYSLGLINCTCIGMEGVGGLIGINSGNVVNSFSTTRLECEDSLYIGGFIGWNQGNCSSCFWDIQTSGTADGVGFIDPDPTGVSGLTTTEMQDINTFTTAGWDFLATWDICDGTNYPKLICHIPPGDIICPDGVTLKDFAIFSVAWLTSQGQPAYNEACNLIDDDTINIADLAVFAQNWMQGI